MEKGCTFSPLALLTSFPALSPLLWSEPELLPVEPEAELSLVGSESELAPVESKPGLSLVKPDPDLWPVEPDPEPDPEPLPESPGSEVPTPPSSPGPLFWLWLGLESPSSQDSI